jgi:hypothetical protein
MLDVLPQIFSFIKISYIENVEGYKEQLNEFKNNVVTMYSAGQQSFLANKDETFYCHALRFYLPSIAEVTFEQHKLGLGIFSMQGFERRNKESKNTARRFLTKNMKSPSLLVNNLRRLLNTYLYDGNSY